VESEEKAEELVERRAALEKENIRSDAAPGNIELHIPGMRSRDNARLRRVLERADLKEGDGVIRIPVVVKAYAGGSLSAIRESLINLGQHSKQKVIIDVVLEGIGDITATDIQMAKESNAVIFSFGNKRVDQQTLNLADSENVKIHSNAIIYSLLDEAKSVLGAYLPQTSVEHVHGSATVQAIFSVGTDDGEDKIAGLKVLDGHIYNDKTKLGSVELSCHFRVIRNGSQISPEGETVRASSLRRYKELVNSVRLGDECGLGLAGFSDFKEGDTIECYSIEKRSVSL
jgi:translation initiation factor IF-2